MRTIIALSIALAACGTHPTTDDRNYAATSLRAIEPKADCVATYTHVGEHHYDHAVCTLPNSAVLECWTADNAALQCTTMKGAPQQVQAPAPAPAPAPAAPAPTSPPPAPAAGSAH